MTAILINKLINLHFAAQGKRGTDKALTEEFGIHPSTLSRWRNGEVEPEGLTFLIQLLKNTPAIYWEQPLKEFLEEFNPTYHEEQIWLSEWVRLRKIYAISPTSKKFDPLETQIIHAIAITIKNLQGEHTHAHEELRNIQEEESKNPVKHEVYHYLLEQEEEKDTQDPSKDKIEIEKEKLLLSWATKDQKIAKRVLNNLKEIPTQGENPPRKIWEAIFNLSNDEFYNVLKRFIQKHKLQLPNPMVEQMRDGKGGFLSMDHVT